MLPAGAYVTLEHEHLLILRKPPKRDFSSEQEKEKRRSSSYFWEERNKWFSDLWELNGTRQALNSKKVRKRSGAFPFEIPFRLINMFSAVTDTILDPFLGTGTTTLAALTSGRNSIGFEFDSEFAGFHQQEIPSEKFVSFARDTIRDRIHSHFKYVSLYEKEKGKLKHFNEVHNFSVMTKQEVQICFHELCAVEQGSKSDIESKYIGKYQKIDRNT